MKFTPGPWTIVRSYPRRLPFGIAGENGIGVLKANAFCRFTKPEAEANAALIASAPELYAEHDITLVDLDLLRKAIEAGDPKDELLLRVSYIQKRTQKVLAKAEVRK